MVALPEEPEQTGAGWDAEGEDLSFIRDEGLELLALYRKIADPNKRRLILEMIDLLAGDQPR